MADPKKFKVLIVDDDRDLVETVVESFDEAAFKLVCSYDGQEASFKFKNEDFDAIITDIRMPKCDGIEFIRNIRKTKTTPIFVISASIDDFRYALKQFPNTHLISKPFSPADLNRKVVAALKPATKDPSDAEMRVKEGDSIFIEDSIPTEIFFVKEGRFCVYKKSKSGAEIEVAVVGVGEILGEMGALSGEKRTASVKAMTNGVLIKFPIEKVNEILNTQPKWFKVMVKSLTDRLSATTQELAEVKSELKNKK